jgi:hypothetical protein
MTPLERETASALDVVSRHFAMELVLAWPQMTLVQWDALRARTEAALRQAIEHELTAIRHEWEDGQKPPARAKLDVDDVLFEVF